jgi:hypothetical protein
VTGALEHPGGDDRSAEWNLYRARGVAHQWGKPKATKLLAKARDPESARRLWELSVELTGCDLPESTAAGHQPWL